MNSQAESKLKLATVFSGIGAIEQAMLRTHLNHEIVFACDNGDLSPFVSSAVKWEDCVSQFEQLSGVVDRMTPVTERQRDAAEIIVRQRDSIRNLLNGAPATSRRPERELKDRVWIRLIYINTLVTDKMNSYVRFTNANGIDLVQLKTGKAKKGIYNIQHINSYHSQLKRFMRGFNGVSTKYLNNYLVWNNLVNYAKESDMEKRNIFLTFVLATLKTAKCRDLSNRPAVPLVA